MIDNTYDDLIKAWESYIADIKKERDDLRTENDNLRKEIRILDEQIRKLSICGVCG